MFDFLKIRVSNKELIKRLDNNKSLKLVKQINNTRYDKDFKGVYFEFGFKSNLNKHPDDTTLNISFRIHKFYNNNQHNATSFTATQCQTAIRTLQNDLNLSDNDLKHFKIIGLEMQSVVNLNFGNKNLSNAIKPILTKRKSFINSNGLLQAFKGTTFNRHGVAQNYESIKLYNKHIQKDAKDYCDLGTWKFEVTSNQSRYAFYNLDLSNLFNLIDVNAPYRFELIKIALQSNAMATLLTLPSKDLDFEKLDVRASNKLNKYLNVHNWINKKNGFIYANRNSFHYAKKYYNELLDKIGFNINKEFQNLIISETNQTQDLNIGCDFSESLTRRKNEILEILQGSFKNENQTFDSEIKPSKNTINPKFSNPNPNRKSNACHGVLVANVTIPKNPTLKNTFEKVDKRPPLKMIQTTIKKTTIKPRYRICPILNLELHHDDKNAYYSRTATLKHLEKTDYQKFLLIKADLLKSDAMPKFENTTIKRMCKAVRNRFYSRQKIKSKRKIKQPANQLKIEV